MTTTEPQRQSQAERVAFALESDLLADKPAPGTHLALRTELIQRFSVSPSVMNEALRILRERGLVSVKPGPKGGVFAADIPPQVRLGAADLWFQGLAVDPEQLFEARGHLEETFNRVASQRCTAEDGRRMEWALDELHRAAVLPDPRPYMSANMRLHLAIAEAAHIDVLHGMYQSIYVTLMGCLNRATWIPDHEPVIRNNLEVHGALVAAIRRGDMDALQAAITAHTSHMVRI